MNRHFNKNQDNIFFSICYISNASNTILRFYVSFIEKSMPHDATAAAILS